MHQIRNIKVDEMILRKMIDIFDRRWDFYYLQTQLRMNIKRRKEKDTLISGSSYGIFGIEPIETCINLALPSQDIYYSAKLVEEAITDNANIKKVFLCFGYYSIYCDLSKSKENWRIDEVYYPLLRDSHNRKENEKRESNTLEMVVKNFVTKIIDVGISCYFNLTTNYFNKILHSRIRRRFIVWDEKKSLWSNLDEMEKDKAGKKRVNMHEKQLKYADSLLENLSTLDSLYKFCKARNIKLNIFLFPFTKEYLSNMSTAYQKKATEAIGMLKRYCDFFIDFNQIASFETEDFVDCDHLGDAGARKMTKYFAKYFIK